MKKLFIATFFIAAAYTYAAPIVTTIDIAAERLAWVSVRDIATGRIAYLDGLVPVVTPPPPPVVVPPASNPKELPDQSTTIEYFRTTTAGSYLNPTVSFTVNLQRFWETNAQKPGHGLSAFLRYQSQYNLYTAHYGMMSGNVAIKKKCVGGSSNGGTYYDLVPQKALPLPLNKDVKISASIKDEGENVRINMYRDGVLVLSGLDTGQGCARIKSAGKVGLRADSAIVSFKDFQVE